MKKQISIIGFLITTQLSAACYYITCYPAILSGKVQLNSAIETTFAQINQKMQTIKSLHEKKEEVLQKNVELNQKYLNATLTQKTATIKSLESKVQNQKKGSQIR